jgi:hypothetical protein
MPELYVALVHHPVVNRSGETIAAAVTNLDLHDIARAACTYGVKAYFVVTPVADQRILAERIVAHWTTGAGGRFLPDRRSAMELVRISGSIAEAVEAVAAIAGKPPLRVATSARAHPRARKFSDLRRLLAQGEPHLLMLGTAWGLAESVIETADHVLEPICGPSGYNHLSVRGAAAIILDRLLGRAE